MQGHRIGYVRVSSFDQNPERQLEHVPVDRLFTDKASGKDTQRPQLEAMLGFVGQYIGTIGVDHNVLGCRNKGQEHRPLCEKQRLPTRREAGHGKQSQGQPRLRQDQPTASATEPRRLETIHQRRPQELERIGDADQPEKPDGGEVNAIDSQPGLQGLAGQGQRQARSKPQEQHRRQAMASAEVGHRLMADRAGKTPGFRSGWDHR